MPKVIQLKDETGSNAYPVTGANMVDGLANVAKTGNYNDLSNKPTIPTVPAMSTDVEADGTSDSKTSTPKSVKTFVEGKGYYTKPQSGIPASDMEAGVIPTVPTDIVKYSTQSLTDAQKEQARTNIGAADVAEVSQLRSEVTLSSDYTDVNVGSGSRSVYVGEDTTIGAIGDIIADTSTNSFAAELEIPENANEVYFYSRTWSSGARGYAFLDSLGNVLSYDRVRGNTYITVPVPAGATILRISLYTTYRDVVFHISEKLKEKVEDIDNEVGYSSGIESAELAIRAKTNSSSVTDNPEGTRIRVVFPVSAGMRLYAKTTDQQGLYVGVWDTLAHAINSSPSTGMIQSGVGYTTDGVDYDIDVNGYLCVSLTNGTTAISDARKQELLDSLSLVIGAGLSFDTAKNALLTEANGAEIRKMSDPQRVYSYFGNRINVGGGFDWSVFATNAAGGQSSARFGDYLFIVLDELAKIKLYNLKTKTMLCEVAPGLTPDDTWHCNQSSFGHFASQDDMFPVLYVSMRNDTQGRCSALGFRIFPTIANGEVSAIAVSLVQTIKFPSMTDTNCLGNANATFDLSGGYLWTYSRNNNSAADNYQKARFTKFAIPDLTSSVVELSDSDILDAFSDDWSMYNAQGGFIGNGHLVIMQGYPSAGYIWCRVIDLYLEKKQTSLIDLLAAGVTSEPEGVFYYDGKIMASTNSATIIAIDYD